MDLAMMITMNPAPIVPTDKKWVFLSSFTITTTLFSSIVWEVELAVQIVNASKNQNDTRIGRIVSRNGDGRASMTVAVVIMVSYF